MVPLGAHAWRRSASSSSTVFIPTFVAPEAGSAGGALQEKHHAHIAFTETPEENC
jgi:hypothetical protein